MHDAEQQLFQIHTLIESVECNLQATTELLDKSVADSISPEIRKSLQSNKRQLECSLAEAKSRIKDVTIFMQLHKAAKKHGAINPNIVAQYLITSNSYYEGADCNYLVERIKRSPDTAYLFKASESTVIGVADNPWRKESFNLTRQGEIIKSNPSLAEQLRSEASRSA